MESNIKIGKIKFISDKGYGFLAADKQDYFFHVRNNRLIDFKSLLPGTMVEFVATENAKGPEAVRMIIMSDRVQE
jgi:cold shock CspA family protein